MKNTIMAIAVGCSAILIGCADGELTESVEFHEEIENVLVDLDLGDINVTATPTLDTTKVSYSLSCRTVVPEVHVFIEDNTLKIELDAGSDASACDGTVEIFASSFVDVSLKTDSGNIKVDGIDGNCDIATFDGDVTLQAVTGDINVAAVSGNIAGSDLGPDVAVLTVGAGDVALSYTTVPSLVDVDVMMGNATLMVPRSTYNVDANANGGDVVLNGISVSTTAADVLTLTLETGDIDVWGI